MRKNIIIILLSVIVLILIGTRVYQHFSYRNIVDKTTLVSTINGVKDQKNILEATETNSGEDQKAVIDHFVKASAVNETSTSEKDELENITPQQIKTSLAEAAGKKYEVFINNHFSSPNDIEKLTALLGELNSLSPEFEELKSYEEKVQYMQEKRSNLQEFLGYNRYQEFLQFQDSIPERNTINMFITQLNKEDKLDEDTREKLILALYKERKILESPEYLASEESKGMSFSESYKLELEKYQTAAKGILSESQMKVFEKELEKSAKRVPGYFSKNS